MIPIYRAKKIDSDEYVIGYLKHDKRYNHYCINPIDESNCWYVIDQSALAIHFSDMLDSQRNKIFASLNKDGKGGDIVFHRYSELKGYVAYLKNRFYIINDSVEEELIDYNDADLEVIGIQQ